MLAVKINDPVMEKELAAIASKQHISRQAVVRSMLAKQLEDAADYRAAVKAKRRLESGESVAIPLEQVMRRFGMEV